MTQNKDEIEQVKSKPQNNSFDQNDYAEFEQYLNDIAHPMSEKQNNQKELMKNWNDENTEAPITPVEKDVENTTVEIQEKNTEYKIQNHEPIMLENETLNFEKQEEKNENLDVENVSDHLNAMTYLINGHEFKKFNLDEEQAKLVEAFLKLNKDESRNIIEENNTPTGFLPPVQENEVSDLDRGIEIEGDGQKAQIKNYSLLPNMNNFFKKDRLQDSLNSLTNNLGSNRDNNAIVENTFDQTKHTISNDHKALQSAVAAQLAVEKMNDLIDSHRNTSESIEKIWKRGVFDDFKGSLVEDAKNQNVDLNKIIRDINEGKNEPRRKEFQNLITNLEYNDPLGKSDLIGMVNSQNEFMRKSKSAMDMLKNDNLDPDMKKEMSYKLKAMIENQENISSKLPDFVNNEGEKIKLSEQLKKFAEQLKASLQVIINSINNKFGVGQSNDSPAP
ncbi:hypothetical protein [Acinetobacter sp. Marseille-Q1618]|uniref:hypothetical protein n=1 Tax=Acinetobacter sp. Marseille-Q1618 TaxID=2697502 RepID=UPI0015700DF3|nr:hypothetical protein [Acinetobacter sp. Marseille-Q1618]